MQILIFYPQPSLHFIKQIRCFLLLYMEVRDNKIEGNLDLQITWTHILNTFFFGHMSFTKQTLNEIFFLNCQEQEYDGNSFLITHHGVIYFPPKNAFDLVKPRQYVFLGFYPRFSYSTMHMHIYQYAEVGRYIDRDI